MLFSEVTGQKEIKNALLQSVNEGRISHAQLFLGSEGSGNFPMALAFAQYVLCSDPGQEDACNHCSSCTKVKKLIHPDLHFVFPVATTRSVTKNPVSDDFISEWRNFVLSGPYITEQSWYRYMGVENKQGVINRYESLEILRKLSLKTYEADYKIMIIWLPEKMNLTAANKLLKILEEPPEGTVFLLVAEHTDGMLPTVLSRVQLLKFPPVKDQDLLEAFLNADRYDEKAVRNAVSLAAGNYSRMMESLESGGEKEDHHQRFVQLMRHAYAIRLSELLDWIDEMASLGREKQKSFLKYALRMIRENFMMNLGESSLLRLTDEEKAFSVKFSAFINRKNTERITEEINLAFSHIEANAYARIVFLDLSLKLARLIKTGKE